MQSDFIRLCVLNREGGLYIDADHQSRKPLRTLIEDSPHATALIFHGLLNNGFLMFRRSGNAFIQACLELALDNIEHRRFNITFMAAGPGVYNAIRALIEPSSLTEIMAGLDNPFGRSWGFEMVLERASAVINVTDELIDAYEAITLINAYAASLWFGSDDAEYKHTDRHWLRWKGPSFR